MRLKSLLRFGFFVSWIFCLALGVRCLGTPTVQSATVPHVASVPGSIHIKYSFTRTQQQQPKAFLDMHIAELNKKIKQAEESPGGKDIALMHKQNRAYWQRKYVAAPPEYGQAEYWGTKSGMIWSNGKTAYAYNGEYNTSAHPGDLFPSLFGSNGRPEWLHVVPGTNHLELVPYLGFMQPGKDRFPAGRSMAHKTNTGFEERRDVKQGIHGSSFTLVAQYDASGRLISITKQIIDLVLERFQFSDYAGIRNDFFYPRNVKVTTYMPYKVGENIRTFPSEVVVYTAQSADTKPIDISLFDANHPRVGVVVQDWRYKSKSRPGGVQYQYTDSRLTVSEASAIAARQQDGGTDSKVGLLATAVRLVSFAAVLLLLGRAVLALVRKGRAQNE